jgi:hypothetical protein
MTTATEEPTLEEIEEVLAQAKATGANVYIRSYISNDGAQSSMIVKLLGPYGYKEILTDSLELLAKGLVDLKVEDGVEVGAQAAAALSASWSKSLANLHKKRDYKEDLNLEELETKGYTRNSREQIVIKNAYVENMMREKLASRPEGRTPLVRAKREIIKQTPMAKFRGQLNLSPEKIRGIYVIDDDE